MNVAIGFGVFMTIGSIFAAGYHVGYWYCWTTQCAPLVDAIRKWKLARKGGFDEPPAGENGGPMG